MTISRSPDMGLDHANCLFRQLDLMEFACFNSVWKVQVRTISSTSRFSLAENAEQFPLEVSQP